MRYQNHFIETEWNCVGQIVEEASKHARVLVDLSFYSSLDDYLDVFQNSTMIFELRAATVNNSDGHSFITHEDGDSELPMVSSALVLYTPFMTILCHLFCHEVFEF